YRQVRCYCDDSVVCSLVTQCPPPISNLFPYTTLFRSLSLRLSRAADHRTLLRRRARGVHGSRCSGAGSGLAAAWRGLGVPAPARSEEHTSELQSHLNLVCRLPLEKKKNTNRHTYTADS